MNLIDQALKDKLKLFDEIDRELGTESSYKNTTNKLNNNNNSQFDKIYSNFLLDQYQPKNIFNFKTTTKTNSNNNTINNNKKKIIIIIIKKHLHIHIHVQIVNQFNVQILLIKILFYQTIVEIVYIITVFI